MVTSRGIGESGIRVGFGTRGGENIARGEEGSVNGKSDFVVLVAEGWPGGPNHRHHRLVTGHRRLQARRRQFQREGFEKRRRNKQTEKEEK